MQAGPTSLGQGAPRPAAAPSAAASVSVSRVELQILGESPEDRGGELRPLGSGSCERSGEGGARCGRGRGHQWAEYEEGLGSSARLWGLGRKLVEDRGPMTVGVRGRGSERRARERVSVCLS